MDIETIREYCLKRCGRITEEFPFGEDVLVFKVHGKAFLMTRLDCKPFSINLKCDPDHAVELRERYEAVQPGYHMNKKHWNTVIIDGSIPSSEIKKMIDHSYDMVVAGLPKKVKEQLKRN